MHDELFIRTFRYKTMITWEFMKFSYFYSYGKYYLVALSKAK